MSEHSFEPRKYILSKVQTHLATEDAEFSNNFYSYEDVRRAMRGMVPDGLVPIESNATGNAHEKRLIALREEQSSEPLRPLIEIISNAFDAQKRANEYSNPTVELYISATSDGGMKLAVSDRTSSARGDGMTPEIFFSKFLTPFASGNDTGVTIGTMGVGAQQSFGLLRTNGDKMHISSRRDGVLTMAQIARDERGELHIVPGGLKLNSAELNNESNKSGTIVSFHLSSQSCRELGLNTNNLQKYLHDKFAGYPGELKLHSSGTESNSVETILTHKQEDMELIGHNWDTAKIKYSKNIAEPGKASKVYLTMMGVTFGDPIEVTAAGLPEEIFLDVTDKSLVTEGRKTVKLNESLLGHLRSAILALKVHTVPDQSLRIGMALESIVGELGNAKNLPVELRLQPRYDLKQIHTNAIRALITNLDDQKFVACPSCFGDILSTSDSREIIVIPDVYTKGSNLIPLESLSTLGVRQVEGLENSKIHSATFPPEDRRMCVAYNDQYLVNLRLIPDLHTPNGLIRLKALFENLHQTESEYVIPNITYLKPLEIKEDNEIVDQPKVHDENTVESEPKLYDKEGLIGLRMIIKERIAMHAGLWTGYTLDQKKMFIKELYKIEGSNADDVTDAILEENIDSVFKVLNSEAFCLNYEDYCGEEVLVKPKKFIHKVIWLMNNRFINSEVVEVYNDLHHLSGGLWVFDIGSLNYVDSRNLPILLELQAVMKSGLTAHNPLNISLTDPENPNYNKMESLIFSAPKIFRYLNKDKLFVEQTIDIAKKLDERYPEYYTGLLMSHPRPLTSEQISAIDKLLDKQNTSPYGKELINIVLSSLDTPSPIERVQVFNEIINLLEVCIPDLYGLRDFKLRTFLDEIRNMPLPRLVWGEKILKHLQTLSAGIDMNDAYVLYDSVSQLITSCNTEASQQGLSLFFDTLVPKIANGEMLSEVFIGYLSGRSLSAQILDPFLFKEERLTLNEFVSYAQSTNLVEQFDSMKTTLHNWRLHISKFIEKKQNLKISLNEPPHHKDQVREMSVSQLLLEDLAPGEREFSDRAHADAMRELLHPINRCVGRPGQGYTEVIKNALEAIDRTPSAERKIVISDFQRPLQDGKSEYWMTCEDLVGMSIFDAMSKLTLPSKGEGMHGIGFLKLLADADKVIVQTGDGEYAGTIIYTPVKDSQGIITNLKMEVGFDVMTQPIRKGTVVHVCKYTDDPVPVALVARESLMAYVQAVPEHTAQVVLSRLDGAEQSLNHGGNDINSFNENGIGVHFQLSLLGSTNNLSYAGRGIESYRCSDILTQSNLPKGVARLLDTSGIHIDLTGIRLTRDGSGIIHEDQVLSTVRHGINEMWRETVKKLMQTGKLDVEDFLKVTLGPRVFDSPDEAVMMPNPPTDLSSFDANSNPYDFALFLYKSPLITIPELGMQPTSLSNFLIGVRKGLLQQDQLPPRLAKLVVKLSPPSPDIEHESIEGLPFTKDQIDILKPILYKGAHAVGIQDVSFALAGEQNSGATEGRVIPTSVTRGDKSAIAYYRPGGDSLHFGEEQFMKDVNRVANPNAQASVIHATVHELTHVLEQSKHTQGVHSPRFYAKVENALLTYEF